MNVRFPPIRTAHDLNLQTWTKRPNIKREVKSDRLKRERCRDRQRGGPAGNNEEEDVLFASADCDLRPKLSLCNVVFMFFPLAAMVLFCEGNRLYL